MRRFGLIGRGISHSFSAEYFNKKFADNNIDARYESFDIPDISLISEIRRTPDLEGLNVTSPYKREVIPFMDELTDEAKALNAVNVIEFFRDASGNLRFRGHNTDSDGFGETLTRFNLKGPALIMGTGGASSAVAYALSKKNIPFYIVSRTPKGEEVGYEAMRQMLPSSQLIVNATPVGMHPHIDEYPDIDYDLLTPHHICYDLIYNPSETIFLRRAKEKGAVTYNGLQMLLNQAELAWEIWNKHPINKSERS